MRAQAIAEEKARELAVANGLVAEKTRQYAEVQRLITESEQAAAALDDKFKMQMLETKQERCVLAFTWSCLYSNLCFYIDFFALLTIWTSPGNSRLIVTTTNIAKPDMSTVSSMLDTSSMQMTADIVYFGTLLVVCNYHP